MRPIHRAEYYDIHLAIFVRIWHDANHRFNPQWFQRSGDQREPSTIYLLGLPLQIEQADQVPEWGILRRSFWNDWSQVDSVSASRSICLNFSSSGRNVTRFPSNLFWYWASRLSRPSIDLRPWSSFCPPKFTNFSLHLQNVQSARAPNSVGRSQFAYRFRWSQSPYQLRRAILVIGAYYRRILECEFMNQWFE